MVVADQFALFAEHHRDATVTSTESRTRAIWMLVAGALVGTVFAGRDVISSRTAIAPDAAATVDGVVITHDEFDQALRAAEQDRGSPLTTAEQTHVLDRLIGEELLFARALALDLPRKDARLHAEIVTTYIAEVVAPAEHYEPTEAELLQHLEANAARFTAEPLVRVNALLFTAAGDQDGVTADVRAQVAVGRLRAGEPVDQVAADSDKFPLPVPVPASWTSREALTTALGPTAATTALALAEGAVSEPIRTHAGTVIVHVIERRAATPMLDEVREHVRAELVRQRGERQLRETIDELRSRADVRLAR